MSENKQKNFIILFLPEAGCMLLAALGMFALSYFGLVKAEPDRALCNIVLTVVGISVVGYELRIGIIRRELNYDNDRHVGRFFLCFLMGLAVAFACVFLPAGAWPFLAVFVLLGLFGSRTVGILSGAILLTIPVLLADWGIEVYLLYLICGVCGVALFGNLRSGFRSGRSFFLSLSCLGVCLTAGTVLVVNSRPAFEDFLVPVANLIVSGILLFLILKFFSVKIVYRYREKYLDLNDSENEFLASARETDKDKYKRIVHTTHFCESIALRLDLDQEALKCAGYYHEMGDELPAYMTEHDFPPDARRILEDFCDRATPVRYKETAVLIASADVIGKILTLIGTSGEKKPDYDSVIDEIFEKYYEDGFFNQCDITVKELAVMHKIFKEEKLYYDFLR